MPQLQTGGYALSDLPAIPDVPKNIGVLDVKGIYDRTVQALQAQNALSLNGPATLAASLQAQADARKALAQSATIPSATAADIASNTATVAQAPLKTTQLATQVGSQVATQPSATAATIAQNQAAGTVAPSTAATTVAANNAATQQSLADLEKQRQLYEGLTDPTAKAAQKQVYVQSLLNSRKNLNLTGAAFDQALKSEGIDPATGQPPQAAAPAAAPVSAPQAAPTPPLAGSVPPSGPTVSQPLASVQPAAVAPLAASPAETGGALAQTSTAPLAQTHSNPFFKQVTDPVSGTVMTRTLGPDGFHYASTPMTGGAEQAQKEARDAIVASGLPLGQYQNQSGFIANPAQALADAQKIVSAPTYPGKVLPIQYPNAGAGLPPVQAVAARNKERNESADVINNEVAPATESIDSTEGAVRQLMNYTSQIPGGAIVGSKLFQNLVKVGTDAKSLFTPADKQALGDNYETAVQVADNLRNRLIPALMRSTNPNAALGGGQSGTGGASGLGRIMQTEVPWLSSASGDSAMTHAAQNITLDRALTDLNGLSSGARFLSTYQRDGGTLKDAGNTWIDYRTANPKYDAAGNPVTSPETYQAYLARVAADPSQVGKPAPASQPSSTQSILAKYGISTGPANP
jgi:hypothetical protein